jgi:hypothetical protein
VNRLCKEEEAFERSLILPSLLAVEETATFCGVSVTPEGSIIRKRQERNEGNLVQTPGD